MTMQYQMYEYVCVRVLHTHQGLGCFQSVMGMLKEALTLHWGTSVGAAAKKGEHLSYVR